MRKRVVYYFGTFNPIHKGHLNIIKSVVDRFDKFILVLTPNSPAKKAKTDYLNENQRKEVIDLSISDENLNHKVEVSMVEFNLPKPNFTITTLERLQMDYPLCNWKSYILMGMDNFIKLPKWKNFSKIVEYGYEILVIPRDTESTESNEINYEIINEKFNISSTEIRSYSKEELQNSPWITESAKKYLINQKFKQNE